VYFSPDDRSSTVGKEKRYLMSKSNAALEKEVLELEGKVNAATAAYDDAAAQLEQRRARLRECDAEISGLTREKEELSKQLTDSNVERKKLEHK
jgi:structural maintenance of chromosome 2